MAAVGDLATPASHRKVRLDSPKESAARVPFLETHVLHGPIWQSRKGSKTWFAPFVWRRSCCVDRWITGVCEDCNRFPSTGRLAR